MNNKMDEQRGGLPPLGKLSIASQLDSGRMGLPVTSKILTTVTGKSQLQKTPNREHLERPPHPLVSSIVNTPSIQASTNPMTTPSTVRSIYPITNFRENKGAYIFITRAIYQTPNQNSLVGGSLGKLLKLVCSCIWINNKTFPNPPIAPNVTYTPIVVCEELTVDNPYSFETAPQSCCKEIALQIIKKTKIVDSFTKTNTYSTYKLTTSRGESVYAIKEAIVQALKLNPIANECFERFLVALNMLSSFLRPNLSNRIKQNIIQLQLQFLPQVASLSDLWSLMQSLIWSVKKHFTGCHVSKNVVEYLTCITLYSSLFKASLDGVFSYETQLSLAQSQYAESILDISMQNPVLILANIESLNNLSTKTHWISKEYLHASILAYRYRDDKTKEMFLRSLSLDFFRNTLTQLNVVANLPDSDLIRLNRLFHIAGALTYQYESYKQIFTVNPIGSTTCVFAIKLSNDDSDLCSICMTVDLNVDGIFRSKLNILVQVVESDNSFIFIKYFVEAEGGDWTETEKIYFQIVTMLKHLYDHTADIFSPNHSLIIYRYLLTENPQFREKGVHFSKLNQGAPVIIQNSVDFKIIRQQHHGGKSGKPTHITFKENNKQYKIRHDGRKRYIMVNKEPIYLKDMPGKYKYQ